ncbi:cupin domain-containing protein [Cupriavidus sp. CuC1]|uniref:cupin domain-containing protein n=1 Tax=Cupriavidus sp. CuC1 TaxID=3373131 RepID=UPI0037D9357C
MTTTLDLAPAPSAMPKHCERIATAGSPGADTPALANATRGEAFDMGLHRLEQAQSLAAAKDEAGEEVATVLDGTFRIDAAGETYVLSSGEGIIIPSGAPRVWTCTSIRGTLYRVINRTSLDGGTGEAS